MFKKTLIVLLILAMIVTNSVGCTSKEAPAGGPEGSGEKQSQEEVTIEYWQYFYESKVKLMDALIAEFQEQNPGIKVVHKNFPYDSYQQKIATSMGSGTGPDIINLFYGWVPKYVKAGTLQELPTDTFSHEMIEKDFAPMVQVNKIDGKYYTIPTAVRTMALFWNKDIFAENGLDPEKPPKDLDEMLEFAKKMTKREKGALVVEGMTYQPSGQLHAWFRPVLLKQFGQEAISEDNKKVLWNASENGYKAFEFFTDLAKKHQVGENNFYTDDVTAFMSGKAAMHIDGSYRLGSLDQNAKDLNYGVAHLPQYNGVESSFASFWTNGITKNATGAKLEASKKFLEFLSSPEVMIRWTKEIGEIGARVEIAENEELLQNEKLRPFIEQLPVSTSYFYVDETGDRKALIDAIDKVLLNNVDPRVALDEAVEEVQAILDEYWGE
ncbi:MAG: extracellular solute-binding protein [Thermotaleaceae bacterium]